MPVNPVRTTCLPTWALVFVGGCLGTFVRWAVGLAVSSLVAVAVVNLVGAFCLGMLYARTRRTEFRLLLGTGFLGAFTTYGGMAVLAVRSGPVGVVWATVLVAAGAAAAWAGQLCGARREEEPS